MDSKGRYCPFKKFCVFLEGNSPESVLAERDYLRKRVDELEFSMDFSNRQVKKLIEQVKELENEKTNLENELSEALQAPFNKYDRKEPSETPKKRGAPVGHPGWFRTNPEHIDKTVDVYLEACPHCGSENISPCNHTTEHIQEDLENGSPVVTCFLHLYYWCPECKKTVHGWGENEIPNAFIGPEVRAKTSFLRNEIKVSYSNTSCAVEYLCGITVSPGAVVGFDHKLAEKASPVYNSLKQSLTQTPYIHVDETGWKRNWLWIFTNPDIAFFHIDESRGSKVVTDHFGEFYNGVLITDFWSAYRSKVNAFAKQKCLTHLLRDIKAILDRDLVGNENAEAFLNALKALIKDAIFLHHQHPVLTNEKFRSTRREILGRFRKLLLHKPLKHHEADNIRKRLITFKDELFVFLKYPQISPTNNAAEQGIRNAVLFRKITFGNTTERGKTNVSVIMTIIRTAKLRGLNPVKVLQEALTGKSVLLE